METPQPKYYLGVITKILDPDTYEVEIEIPGVTKEAKAYPYRDTVDEPKPEDLVLVLGLDPVYNSVWLYQKLKENNFIGSTGKESNCIGSTRKDNTNKNSRLKETEKKSKKENPPPRKQKDIKKKDVKTRLYLDIFQLIIQG